MNRPHALLVLLFVSAGCIEGTRRTQVFDTVEPDTFQDDTAQLDTVEDTDTSVDDTDTSVDDTDTSDTDVSLHPCLPAGCVEPGPACALSPGFCWIDGCVADDTRNPENSCEHCKAGVAARAWTKLADAESCDDGLDCTENDICRQGVCRGESLCSSALDCVTSRCDPTAKVCVDEIRTDMCRFGGECYEKGQLTPQNCGRCDPAISQTEPVAGDAYEPNDGLDQATSLTYNNLVLTTAADQDVAWNGPWTHGTLSPALDTDAYTWLFTVTSGVVNYPVVKVTRVAGVQLDVCVYARCLPEAGENTRPLTKAQCTDNDQTDSDGQWTGCCRTLGASDIVLGPTKVWCERGDDEVTARVEAAVTLRRVVPPVSPACYPYELRWGVR